MFCFGWREMAQKFATRGRCAKRELVAKNSAINYSKPNSQNYEWVLRIYRRIRSYRQLRVHIHISRSRSRSRSPVNWQKMKKLRASDEHRSFIFAFEFEIFPANDATRESASWTRTFGDGGAQPISISISTSISICGKIKKLGVASASRHRHSPDSDEPRHGDGGGGLHLLPHSRDHPQSIYTNFTKTKFCHLLENESRHSSL